jgi:hypothetical protein
MIEQVVSGKRFSAWRFDDRDGNDFLAGIGLPPPCRFKGFHVSTE